MPRELIARGQATIYTQQDSYTITQSLAEYIFEATNDGVIPRDVVFASTVSVTLGGSAVSDFAIGAIVKPAGFALSLIHISEPTRP